MLVVLRVVKLVRLGVATADEHPLPLLVDRVALLEDAHQTDVDLLALELPVDKAEDLRPQTES